MIETKFFDILKILKDNNVDITTINGRYSKEGKRYYTCLKDIKQAGIDMLKIISDNNLDENYSIGQQIRRIRTLYNRNELTDEEVKIAEELGIVKRLNPNVQKPLIKGGKFSNFHLSIVKSNIDKILSGELNNTQLRDLINEQALEIGEIQIKDLRTIKRMVEMLLSDEPDGQDKLQRYYKILKENARNNYKKVKNYRKIPLYHDEEEFRKKVIEEYLPKILNNDITLKTIKKELATSNNTIDRIIEEHYLQLNDAEGLNEYQNAKKRNSYQNAKKRNSYQNKERTEIAHAMRKEVEDYKVVSNAEFLLLSKEEQEDQILMKIRQLKLQEEKTSKKNKTRLITEKTTLKFIKRIQEYFRGKNDLENNKEYFSELDIRYIIFRYPTIIGRTEESLNEKIKVLTSYDEIDEETAYGMIKTFPAIIGYDCERTKKQLDILKKEKLIASVVSNPIDLMRSANLIYALIQFAKERYKTDDLSGINRNSIFIGNSILKRLYNTTYEEIKMRFPYELETNEENCPYFISAVDIGKATFDATTVECDLAQKNLNGLVQKKENGKGIN